MPMLTFEGVFGAPVGTCRYSPPTNDCTWPIVLKSDWCGKFKINPTISTGSLCEGCAMCVFFNNDKILGQHPAVPA